MKLFLRFAQTATSFEQGLRVPGIHRDDLFAGFLLCFLLIAGRAFWLQGVQGAELASEATYQQTDLVTVPGLRGSVLDRFGNPLAVSEDAKTIYATPYQVKQPVQTADKLASILELERGRQGSRARRPASREA